MPSAPIRFRDIFLFQIGHADAIRRIVASHWSLVIGALLVFTAGIARNYDQMVLLRHGEKFAGPYIVSVISSVLVFIAIYKSGTRDWDRKDQPNFFRQYPGFLGAFLMTAPLAWFYAIPVEAMTDDLLSAAKWNVFLLSLVSLWRIWLITRVAQVITGAPFWRLLFAILIPSSVEALIASGIAEMNIVGIMGGITLPPDRQFMADALMIVSKGSAICFLGSLVACVASAFLFQSDGWRANFVATEKTVPKGAMMGAFGFLVIWILLATPSQQRYWNRIESSRLIQTKDYDAGIALLRESESRKFPPAGPFWPEGGVDGLAAYSKILHRLQPTDPIPVKKTYLILATSQLFGEVSDRESEYPEEAPDLIAQICRFPIGRSELAIKANHILSKNSRISDKKREKFVADLRKWDVETTPPPPPASATGDTKTTPAN